MLKWKINKLETDLRLEKLLDLEELPEGEGIDWNVVIVDATEIPIQRPKKTEKKL